MNWNIAEGHCMQFKGKIKQEWGNITDDPPDEIAGKRKKWPGQLSASYGISRDQAEIK